MGYGGHMKSLQNLMIGTWLSISKRETCKKLLLVKSLIADEERKIHPKLLTLEPEPSLHL